MSRFLSSRYAGLEPYVPGEQPQDMQYVKLNTNESPFPPSPAVLAACQPAAFERLRLYCDPECVQLRRALAAYYDTQPENIFTANGSDDILNFAFMAFAGSDAHAYFPDITYGFYKVFAQLHKVAYTTIPLREDFTIDIGDYCRRDGMIVLANPNAPTGIALPVAQIEELVRANPDHVVLVDEAYIDFGAQSATALTKQYDNLLVVMTYSKSRSMAGARLGFAIGSRGLIEDLNRIKYATNPYNVNSITQACGIAAANFSGYYQQCCEEISRVRDYTAQKLTQLGFFVLPSKANFLFARHPGLDGETLYRILKQRGVLIRHFSQPRIRQFNRITIGTQEQMDIFLSKTREILKGEAEHENR